MLICQLSWTTRMPAAVDVLHAYFPKVIAELFPILFPTQYFNLYYVFMHQH